MEWIQYHLFSLLFIDWRQTLDIATRINPEAAAINKDIHDPYVKCDKYEFAEANPIFRKTSICG